MNRLTLLPVTFALAASIACGSTSSSTSVGPTPSRCDVAVAPNSSTFPPTGGTGNLVVSAARECSWSASTQASWIALAQPTEGQGDGAVRYTVAPNPEASPRSGTLSVGSRSTQVQQEPAPCNFELDRQSFELSGAEQTATVEVRAPGGCSWTATSSSAWITIVEGVQGNGTGPVLFRVAANTGGPRAGSLQVAGLRVDVRQAAATAPEPPPPPPTGDCTYDLSPASDAVRAEGDTGRFDVRTDSLCAWFASASAPWIEITSGTEGIGDGRVDYRVDANTSTSPRTGTIAVANTQFVIDQEGAPQPPEDERITISGSARSVSGSCPDKTFRVDGRNVRTTSATDYGDGDCGDIRNNTFVRVTGVVGTDGVVTAEEVEF